MRPITGTDILDFYSSRMNLLILTADGEFEYIDNSTITSHYGAYDFVALDGDAEIQILLERTTITDGEWFPDWQNEDGGLDPAVADEMAAIINSDGILDSRVGKAIEASKAWEAAEQTARDRAAARAAAVNEVAAYAGSQSAAARLLSLDQSTVNKLLRKHQAR